MSSNPGSTGRRSPEKIPWTHRIASTEIVPINISDIKFELSKSSHPYENPKLLTPRNTPTGEAIYRAAELLKTSDVPIAFPTETVYGLGADATRDEAVKNIFAAKDRYTDNPLIVHVGSISQARDLMRPRTDSNNNADTNLCVSSTLLPNGPSTTQSNYDIPEVYKPLIEIFWPGPLTILLPLTQNCSLSSYVYADQTTIGVRIPDHPVALALALISNLPIAAPSANRSGLPSPTTAQHVEVDLYKRVELILDGGPCSVGVESTVVDGLCDPPVILRPGGVSLEQLRSCGGVWSKVIVHKESYMDSGETDGTDSPRAPGMKYKHYSPNCYVRLYLPGAEPPSTKDLVDSAYGRDDAKIGVLRSHKWKKELSTGAAKDVSIVDRCLGEKGDSVSKNLFAALREMDDLGVIAVHVEGIEEEGEGLAVMNRLRKAASVSIGPKS